MAEGYQYDFFNVTIPEEYIAVVEINRPEKLNAFHEVMWLNLHAIFNKLSHDPNVRVVLLTAAGEKAFTAGLDVQAASQGPILGGSSADGARVSNGLRRHILEFQAAISAIEKCEKLIALIHGIAFGLALDISLAADIRICTPTARFSIKEVDIGLAADIGTLTRIVHSGVPMSWAKEAALSARVFSGTEAARVGLVSRVTDDAVVAGNSGKPALIKAGMELARTMTGKSPVAVLGTKEIMNYSRGRTVEEGLNYTAVWNAGYLQTGDVKEAMTAGLKKRKVRFEKL